MMRLLFLFTMLLRLSVVAADSEGEAMKGRAMSLDDCLEQALEHNLSLQVERITPLISRANLRLAYAGWEPEFQASYNHEYRQRSSNFDEFGRPISGSASDTDVFSAGFGGRLPTGLTYNLRGNVSNASIDFFGIQGPEFGQASLDNAGGFVSVDLRQPVLEGLAIDQVRLNVKLAKIDIDQTELALLWQIMNVVSQVELAYYDLIAAGESVKVQEKAVQLAEQLFEDNHRRVEIGAMAPLDEKQAASQLARARADLLATRRTAALQQNALKSLLSDDYLQWQDIRIEVTEVLQALPTVFNRQDSWHRAMDLRPDLQQRRMDLDREGIYIRYHKNRTLPQLDLVGSYGYSAGGQNIGYSGVFGQIERQENAFWTVGGQLSIPLGNRAARNDLAIARAREDQALIRLKQFEQDIMVAVENAVALASINLQRVAAIREEREFAEAALQAEEIKLENGKSTSFIVLQLQRDLTQARSSEIQSLVEYNRARAELSLVEGATLQRREITVESAP